MKANWTHTRPALILALGLVAHSAHAAAPENPQGLITGNFYSGISGTALSALTNHAKFPSSPDQAFFFPYFEWNATGDILTPPGEFADNYGGQIVGYFYPPSTGDYIFYIAADDNAELYLSTNADPANKKLIARESTYSGAREYTFSAGNSDILAKDSSQFAGTGWPAIDPSWGGAKITLQQGQPYYIEALFKEGGGGDYLSVAVADPNFVIDYTLPIPGEYLSTDRGSGPATITTQPVSQSVDERGSATFTVSAGGAPPYTFQWRKDGVDIPDATGAIYTVENVALADDGAKISVVVTGPEGSATSEEAVLTVIPDTVQPELLNAKGSPGGTEVILTFSEPVESASATDIANYQVSSSGGALNITGATLSADGRIVTLTTDGQTLGTKYTVTVSNIKDTTVNPNTIPANSAAVFFPAGKVTEESGFIVIEAENFDRNLDGLWVRDSQRGTPSGGASVVVPNGAGATETASKLEYDVEFASAGTYYVWLRASGESGTDDSVWIHLNGERPIERADGNSASLTGFTGADFIWRNDSQDGPDPFTIEIPAAGLHTIALANREDGSFIDKILLTTDSAFTPTGIGPAETREGAPGLPAVAITSPTNNQSFSTGADITLASTATGQSGLEITRVEFYANGSLIGQAEASPYGFTWQDVPSGIYSVEARAFDEIGQSTTSESVLVDVKSGSGGRIAWISFHAADNEPRAGAAGLGFTNAPDVAYTDLLSANGYDVTRVVTTGTPDVELLNAFDLVIISRSVPSGDYETDPETAAWNGITAPTMIMSGYIIRNNRLGLMYGGTIPDTQGPVRLNVADPSHPIFEGVELDALGNTVDVYADLVTRTNSGGVAEVQRGISVVTDLISDGGTVLATVGTDTDQTFGGLIIGEWKAGAVLANDPPDTLGGDRLLFLTGSREINGQSSEAAGMFDLSPLGAELFLNAVSYMSGVESVELPVVATVPGEGGISINFTGTLQSADTLDGQWSNVQGATSPFTVDPNEPKKFYRSTR